MTEFVDNTSASRLLVLCARPAPGRKSFQEIRRLVDQEVDWRALSERADAEGVLPLLYWNLRGLQECVPAGALAGLKAGYLRSLARNAQLYKKLEPFLKAVRQAGLKVVVTKGARLALTLYPDIALRPFWDVDLIVHPSDWAPLQRTLESQAFKEISGPSAGEVAGDPDLDWTYSPYFRRDGLFLEFHFTSLGLHIPLRSEEDFWSAIRPARVRETEMLVLSSEYELCYLCLHVQQHSYQKLVWLADIAELAGREDLAWDRVLGICVAERIQAPVYYSLRLVNSLWPGTVPENRLSKFRIGFFPSAAQRYLWPETAVADRAGRRFLSWPYYMPSLFSLWERKSLLLAFRTLSKIFFPPRSWMAQVAGISKRSPRLYVEYARRLWRPVRLATKRLWSAR